MEIKITTKEKAGKFLYGYLGENKEARTLIVFLSGFSGGKEFSLFKEAQDIFLKNNFSVIRLNFCNDVGDSDGKIDALNMQDMDFSLYVSELKNILDSFGEKYSKIVLIGHSFGAVVSILFLDRCKEYREKTELVLWDPTLLPWKKEWMNEDFILNRDEKLYYGKNGREIMNEVFYNECVNTISTADILQSINKKVCIIGAGNGAQKDAAEYFLKVHNDKKEVSRFFVINNAGHLFEDEHARDELFMRTINFLKI